MSPGSHLLASWLLANSAPIERRERRIVTLTGLVPDLDGIGWFIDHAKQLFGSSSDYYLQYHHLLAHNIVASFVIAAAAAILVTQKRTMVFLLALFAVHLHFVCDVAGSQGPDGYQWPIYYFSPFDMKTEWVWSGQWELDAWQNITITLAMLTVAISMGWRQRYSFVEVISVWLDREFFKMLDRYGYLKPSARE